MKLRHLLLFLFTAPLLFSACKKESFSNKRDYKKSYNAWLSFRSASGNSYRYTTVSSSWIGISQETTITVSNGAVTQRSFIRKQLGPGNPPTILTTEQWTETGSLLNSHNYGSATITLDEIYKKAKEEWLAERENVTHYFETDNAGMISSCGYVPNGCADDCFVGITITSIERL